MWQMFSGISKILKLFVSFTLLVLVVILMILLHKHFESEDIFKVEMKTDLMKIVNPSDPKYVITKNASYLLENKDLCMSVSNLAIVVIVLSAPNNFQRRNAVRETWGNGKEYSSYGTTRVLFLLGTTGNSEVQSDIENEFKLYGDIVQGSFMDSYQNLSHKSVMGYKWITERCRNAKYVIKTDDDIVLNMFRIFQSVVPEVFVNQNHIHCRRLYNSVIYREIGHVFYVKPNQFEGMKYFPPYCNGQYVMMPNDIVPYLYELASKSPFFWIDDVFLYGIVMNNLPSLKYKQIKSDEYIIPDNSYSYYFYFWKRKKTEWRCIYRVTNEVNQMIDAWSAIRKHYE